MVKNSYIYLSEHGIKPSIQRVALMEYLLSHRSHPSVEDIYSALHPELPTLSKTTVYNTMKLFVEHNVALLIGIEEKNARFDGDVSPHGHFLCKKCGKLYDFKLPASHENLKCSLQGFSLSDTQLYCKGICKECNKKNEPLFIN